MTMPYRCSSSCHYREPNLTFVYGLWRQKPKPLKEVVFFSSTGILVTYFSWLEFFKFFFYLLAFNTNCQTFNMQRNSNNCRTIALEFYLSSSFEREGETPSYGVLEQPLNFAYNHATVCLKSLNVFPWLLNGIGDL